MNQTRRSFLKTSGLLASGLAVGGAPLFTSCAESGRCKNAFALQLYTLHQIIGDDPEGIIRTVADYGYQQIESYEGPQGMFWGMGNTGFKRFLDDLGITMISSHANVFNDFERKAAEAAEIGVKYIVCPWIGAQNGVDGYKAMAETFNQLGQTAKNNGITFAYHNHAYTFEPIEGVYPQDILMEETDPELVEYQVDAYWVEVTGQRTNDWIRKYPGRFTSIHIKDLAPGERHESTILGTGILDFPSIVEVGKQHGMQHFIVEQEAFTGTTPLEAIRLNADYMRTLDL